MSEKIKVRILQDDCGAYNIEAKNGQTIEIEKAIADRMVVSGHAVLEKNDKSQKDKDK